MAQRGRGMQRSRSRRAWRYAWDSLSPCLFSCRAAPPARSRAGQLRIWLAEGERGERRRRRRYKAAGAGPDERTSAGGDQDVLLAVDRVDAGGGIDATAECLLPQHLPGRGVERL